MLLTIIRYTQVNPTKYLIRGENIKLSSFADTFFLLALQG